MTKSVKVSDIPEAKITHKEESPNKDSEASSASQKSSLRLFEDVKIPPMQPAVRFVVIVILAIIGVYFLLNALVVGLATIALIPAFLNGLIRVPFESIVGILTYLFALLSYGTLGIVLPTFAYQIFRKKPLKRNLLLLAAAALVLAIVCRFVLLPLFAQLLQN